MAIAKEDLEVGGRCFHIESDIAKDVREDALRQIEALKQAPAAPAPGRTIDRSRRLTAAEKNAAVDTWLEALQAGMSAKEAQELCGVHESTLRRYAEMRARGIPLTDSLPPGRVLGSKSRSPEERRRIAIAALNDHPDLMRASIALGVEVSQVNKYVKQLERGELGDVPPEALERRMRGPRKEPASGPPAPVASPPPAPPVMRIVPPLPPAPEPSPRERELEGEAKALREEVARLLAAAAAPASTTPEAADLARALKDAQTENERLRARIAKLLTLIAED